MNLNTEKFKVAGVQSTGRTFVGIITGAKAGNKQLVSVVRVEESDGVNTGDDTVLEQFLNTVGEDRIQSGITLDALQKCELSAPGEVDNYVLIDITGDFAGKNCVVRFKTGSHTFGSVQSLLTKKRNEVNGVVPVKKETVVKAEVVAEKPKKPTKKSDKPSVSTDDEVAFTSLPDFMAE